MLASGEANVILMLNLHDMEAFRALCDRLFRDQNNVARFFAMMVICNAKEETAVRLGHSWRLINAGCETCFVVQPQAYLTRCDRFARPTIDGSTGHRRIGFSLAIATATLLEIKRP